jgi:hypothetical protein
MISQILVLFFLIFLAIRLLSLVIIILRRLNRIQHTTQ